jgi:hypothetical protein
MATNNQTQISQSQLQALRQQQQQQQINNAIIAQQIQAAQARKPNTITSRSLATVQDHHEQRTSITPIKATVRKFGRV